MSDLPYDELLSVYLDGELTAAERAEVERLLATDPAARQLFDELQALSATLQGLPREKVGEDLSRHVLRIAERRMLTEGEPSTTDTETDTRPEPLVRTVLRRFVNPRVLVWAGLAVAIAVMIRINEQHQAVMQNAGNVDKVVARAPERSDRSPDMSREPRPMPMFQAAPDSRVAVREEAKSLLAGDVPSKAVPATAAPPPSDAYVRKTSGEPAASRLPDSRIAGMKAATAAGKNGAAEARVLTKSLSGAERLVVECDIDVQAAESGAFEKLLVANGIAWRPADELADKADEVKGTVPFSLRRKLGQSPQPSSAKPSGQQKRLYADATPAQITAVLAGLAAQPSLFQNVAYADRDAQPMKKGDSPAGSDDRRSDLKHAGKGGGYKSDAEALSESGRNIAKSGPAELKTSNMKARDGGRSAGMAPARQFEYRQNAIVAGPAMQRGAEGDLDMSVQERPRQQQLAAPSAAAAVAEQGKVGDLSQAAASEQVAPRRPVLFMLNVVSVPTAARSSASPAKPAEAKPAKPSSQP